MNAITKLIAVYNNKSEQAYHKIVEQILLHAQEIPCLSIYELADICYSSTTAISRFVRHLEYGNFHQFKSALAITLNYYPQHNRKMPPAAKNADEELRMRYTTVLCEQLQMLASRLDPRMLAQFTAQIARAEQIIFVAPAPYGFQSFQYDLFLQGKLAFYSDNYTDSENDLIRADEKTFVLFFIPTERESNRTESLLRMALERNAAVGVVAHPNFALRQRVPLCLTYNSTGSDMDDQLFCYIMNLFVLSYRTQYIDCLSLGI